MKIKLSSCLILIVIAVSIYGSGCGSHERSRKEKNSGVGNIKIAGMVFNENEYDFGKVPEGKTVKHIFDFYNNGNGDLSILSVAASCGCTITKYDKRPIPPGRKSTIEVSFDTKGRSGRQSKTISITSNALKPVIMLRISAEIISSNNN